MFNRKALVRKSDHQIIVEEFENNDAILMEPESGTIHSLNSTAYAIYKLCDNACVQDIVVSMISKYPTVTEEKITDAVLKCIESLLQKGLIVVE